MIHHKNIIKKERKKKRGFSGRHSIYEEALLVYCFQRMLVFVEGRKLEDYTQCRPEKAVQHNEIKNSTRKKTMNGQWSCDKLCSD